MPLPAMIPETRPISDLRTHLPEIEQVARETGEPVILTRNGAPALVVFDCQAYNQAVQRERHIRKLREAEIEARYADKTYSLAESKERMKLIARVLEESHA